jgi:hypothetical protein
MSTSPRPDLRNVTACAVDCLNPSVAAWALSKSAALCDFGDVILLTDAVPPVPPEIRIEKIDHIASRESYSRFMLTELHRYIHTSHLLVVQWDGFVVNPAAWRHEFLDYDYIGARWPWCSAPYDIGNGGFSLRSARLMQIMSRPEFAVPEGLPEDTAICHTFRSKLETEHGIRFAPADLADEFSHEYATVKTPSFGFHSPVILGRYVRGEELLGIIRELHPRTFSTLELGLLLYDYYQQIDCLRALYTRIMETKGYESILKRLVDDNLPVERMIECLEACKRLA